MSPNGGSVYVASDVSDTISHFFRAAQGQITWEGCLSGDGSGGFCADLPGTGLALNGATGVAVSPNNASVYVASTDADTVSHFFANPQQGQITWDGCISGDGFASPGETAGFCADIPGTGLPLDRPRGVAVRPNGDSVYVASSFSYTASHFFANRSRGRSLGRAA